MTLNTFRLFEGSLQQRFLNSKAKIQAYGGGFANGKTASAVIKALQLARDYPGSNGLIARSTYPKLNDTIRKEWLKWCPRNWIKSFPMSKNSDNTCTLSNGTMINFRYIEQQGKGKGESTSNLLSATYDWIVIDQIEDPEISRKDFDDLLGRLRGSTPYVGDDPTMPDTGPRWLMVTCNPTRGWFYKTVVRPLQQWMEDGKFHEHLLCETDKEGRPLDDEDGKAIPIIELYEGSTYENQDNLPPDFIKTLESTYVGSMRKRFLLGLWAGYEGLIYPEYDSLTHVVPYTSMQQYLYELRIRGFSIRWLEGFDHGIASPSCYILAFVDPIGMIHCIDGFYEKELSIDDILYGSEEKEIEGIKRIRSNYIAERERKDKNWVLADPAIFRRSGGAMKTVGPAIDVLMWDNGHGVRCIRANNDIINGIRKVQGYLHMRRGINPYTGVTKTPYMFFADKLPFIDTEMSDYYWDKDTNNEPVDKPIDRNDHAMDTLKYLTSESPLVSEINPIFFPEIPSYMKWREIEDQTSSVGHRYG